MQQNLSSPIEPLLDLAAADLARALATDGGVAVLTGAGISAESGVPTFRAAQTGLWAQYDPAELATPEAFAQHPERVWDWYQWRREKVLAADPNPGHWALAQWARRFGNLTLITQNVDGLHRRAGSPQVLELHGCLLRWRCTGAGHRWDQLPADGDRPPACPRGDGVLRPDVVWFGEMLPQEALHQALAATEACAAFLSVGTSSLVYPAAALPERALERGVPVIEVNPEPTPLTPAASHSLRGPAGMVLPALLARL